mmetsp:Transcript_18048/g.30731  ORF Transcript_18048/g.30731 Transcript_18048/m.30731 type:complete len:880 (+) Transcript_18048:153-2792(+)|eukprot:CAMPEP_0203797876 /NCGR_PEP_ID=MMETSP0100_2-20121128/8889_1 /ASSEMBLY_ACC=CAM_ASM_000210 /TAXON_ID=96639 /ORGANISM=" , Strain NY0313808BC1" /LENGTH=879 /DNA_ID=CAMNT_0050703265 /DNA_START=64 /DNA_END=2703 /DNA_ORIENTATION=+
MERSVRLNVLLDDLVTKLVPECSRENGARSELLRYVSRIMSSRMSSLDKEQIGPAGTVNGEELFRLVRRLGVVRSNSTLQEQCDELLLLLGRKSRLKHPQAIVKLLCELCGTGTKTAQDELGVLPLSEKQISNDVNYKLLGKFVNPPGKKWISQQKKEDETLVSSRGTETEALLVRDVIYAFQGIDGHLVKYNPKLERFSIAPLRTISASLRGIVLRLCEVGWLYRRVSKYIHETICAEQLGLVSQSFSSALRDELTEYFRLIAVLESQLDPTDGDLLGEQVNMGGKSDAKTRKGPLKLTLRQLMVWCEEPLVRLQLMAEMADCVQGLIGGALASVVHVYSMHGDPTVSNFVDSIMNRVSAPIFESIRLWVLHGELSDVCNEFFVSVDLSVPIERMWFDKYKLNDSMIPGFLSRELAEKILLIGKSINFIRYCYDDRNVKVEDIGSMSPLISVEDTALEEEFANILAADDVGEQETKQMEAMTTTGSTATDRRFIRLLGTINCAAEKTNAKLHRILFEQFHLLQHCRALKQYLMLGQGDTIQYLMDLLSPQLALPASQVYRHALVAQLETAIRATNAQLDADDVLERVDVRLLESSPGDSGWDVFVLDYHLNPPLNFVITKDAMCKYYEIFNFLWRLKRVEYSLSCVWKQEMTTEHAVRELHGVKSTLHKFHILRNEMVHFISNLHSYIMFEVLETSWETLVTELNAAPDLDHIVQAHDMYLTRILQKSLIGGSAAKGVQHKQNKPVAGEPDANALRLDLQNLFDLILRFCNVQKRLYTSILEQLHKLQRTRFKISQRTKKANWGIDEYEANQDETTYSRPGDADLAQQAIAREYSKQVDLISREYRTAFRSFLAALKPTSSENLRFLRFRLDFNLFYD